MNSRNTHAQGVPRVQGLSQAQGILYAEDFDADVNALPLPEPTPLQPPALTQDDIDAACIKAVQAAQAAWTRTDEQRRTDALATLAAELTGLRASAIEHAESVADSVARTALGMVAGALPHLCRLHGDEEVRMILQRLAPQLATRNRLLVRVHAGLIETLRTDLESLDDALTANIELRPANLQPGDVRLSWEDGALVRDTGVVLAAMQDALAQLGLIDPAAPPGQKPLTENRSLALAQ